MTTARTLFGLSVLLLCRADHAAQEKTARGLSNDAAPLSQESMSGHGFSPRESFGLFVGITDFTPPAGAEAIRPVPYAVDDAVDLAWRFVELGLIEANRVVLAITIDPEDPDRLPRKQRSREHLLRLRAKGAKVVAPTLTNVFGWTMNTRKEMGDRGFLFLTFATHGYTHDNEYFLLCQDSDLRLFRRTGIPVEWIKEEAARAGKRTLILIDACREVVRASRSIEDRNSRLRLSDRLRTRLANCRGLAMLLSSTAGGYSYDDKEAENGVFTAAILRGLGGGAGHDVGLITTETLADYVDTEISNWFRDHHKGRGGIERIFAETADRIPLAEKPHTVASEEARRAGWLDMLRRLVGTGDLEPPERRITAEMVEEVRWALSCRKTSLYFQPVEDQLEDVALGGERHLAFAHWWNAIGRERFGPLKPTIETNPARVIATEQVAAGTAYDLRFRFPSCHATVFHFSDDDPFLAFPNKRHTNTLRHGKLATEGLKGAVEGAAGTVRWIAVATRRKLEIRGADQRTLRECSGYLSLPAGVETRVRIGYAQWQPLDRFLETLGPEDGEYSSLELKVGAPK